MHVRFCVNLAFRKQLKQLDLFNPQVAQGLLHEAIVLLRYG